MNKPEKETTEAGEIARFYGFRPLNAPTITKADLEATKNFDPSFYPAEKAALLRTYFDEKMFIQPQPCMFYCERPFPGSKDRKRPQRLEASIVSLGSTRCVTDCLSIEAAHTILSTLGYKNIEIFLNSVGDKDSMTEFQRNLNSFIRKNLPSFPLELRQALKKDPFTLLRDQRPEWQDFRNICPKTLDFLSEPSRLHFKEVLEFLEIMGLPYTIDHTLVGDPQMASETVFSLRSLGEEVASGFRFNRLAKKIGCKKDLAAGLLNISVKLKKNLKKIKPKKVAAKFYLVQFGLEARLQSFLILRELFKVKIGVLHSIYKDKLNDQMMLADRSGAPYLILIGQKEALDSSVIIRHTTTRAQEIVSIGNLAQKTKDLDGFA